MAAARQLAGIAHRKLAQSGGQPLRDLAPSDVPARDRPARFMASSKLGAKLGALQQPGMPQALHVAAQRKRGSMPLRRDQYVIIVLIGDEFGEHRALRRILSKLVRPLYG